MDYQLHLFLFTVLIGFAPAFPTDLEYFDPNPITSGFSTCYIDLVFFSLSLEFRAPPEIPVTVTYSELVDQTQSSQADAILREMMLEAFCSKKKAEYLRKINCLAVFIISPSQNRNLVAAVDTAHITLLNRYFWIFRCPNTMWAESDLLVDANYCKYTYVTVVHSYNGDESNFNHYSQHDRKLRKLPIFFVYIGTTSTKVILDVELLSPCTFQVSTELLSMENKEASVRT
jgi:hypothetical protein